MAIFDYRCEHCGHKFERIWLGKEGIAQCPECHEYDCRKLVSGGQGFRLIGEGFEKRHHKDTGDWS